MSNEKEEGIKRVSLIMKGIRNLSDYPRQCPTIERVLGISSSYYFLHIEYTYIFTGLRITQFILQLCTVNVKISYKKCSGFHFAHLKVLNSGANKIIFPYRFLLQSTAIKVNALLKQYLYQTVLQPFLFVFPYPPIHPSTYSFITSAA